MVWDCVSHGFFEDETGPDCPLCGEVMEYGPDS